MVYFSLLGPVFIYVSNHVVLGQQALPRGFGDHSLLKLPAGTRGSLMEILPNERALITWDFGYSAFHYMASILDFPFLYFTSSEPSSEHLTKARAVVSFITRIYETPCVPAFHSAPSYLQISLAAHFLTKQGGRFCDGKLHDRYSRPTRAFFSYFNQSHLISRVTDVCACHPVRK
jgi:hypothetical protein